MPTRIPGRRKNLLTEEQARLEEKFGRCPKGHALPHRTERGNCNPMMCAGMDSPVRDRSDQRKGGKSKSKSPKGSSTVVPGDALQTTALAEVDQAIASEMTEAETRIVKAATRHKARMKYVGMPTEWADDKEREKWIESKKRELIPFALAEVEYSLKLGDPSERERARKDVLDMTGHGKREPGGQGGPAQIVIVGMQAGGLPWVRRVDGEGKELKVVDAQLIGEGNAPKQG